MDSSSVADTISLIQRVVKLGKKATNIQYEEAVIAARELILELREQNLALKEENAELAGQKDIGDDLKRDDNNPWLVLLGDSDPVARYCMLCWDKDKELIRLYPDDNGWHEKHCKRCDQDFLRKPGASRVIDW